MFAFLAPAKITEKFALFGKFRRGDAGLFRRGETAGGMEGTTALVHDLFFKKPE